MRWILPFCLLLAACRHAPSAAPIRKKLELDLQRPPAASYAGIDIREALPRELETKDAYGDEVSFDPDEGVVVRHVKWNYYEGALDLYCLVGQSGAAAPARKLPGLLASLGFYAEHLERTDSIGDYAIHVPSRQDRLLVWGRGNIAVVLFQQRMTKFDLARVARWIDEEIQEQPRLSKGAFPKMGKVETAQDLNSVRMGTHIQFTLKPEGERGFLPAGWKIHEVNKTFTVWLDVDGMILDLVATSAGTFTLSTWVINRRQLAVVSRFPVTVVE